MSAPPNSRRGLLLAIAWLIAALALPQTRAADWALTGQLLVHDPSIIEEGGKWWVFGTGPGIRTKASADGLHWEKGDALIKSEPTWWRTYAPKMHAMDVWAPDVHRFGDRVWCYYSVSEFATNHSAIGLLSCSSLEKGDWRDDGLVISSVDAVTAKTPSDPEVPANPAGAPWWNTIDPNLVADADGSPWLVFGSWFGGIRLVQLAPATMKPFGPQRAIAYRPHGIEAPNIVHHGGYYYLFVSIDKCCQGAKSTYKMAYGRSRDITGPYVDRDGVGMLERGGTILLEGGPKWKGPGGQTVYKNGNAWLVAYHAYDADNHGAPMLRISDLYWDRDGWPTLAGP